MSWEDFITHVLATTTKVDKMVIFDLQGRPVAVTDDMETSASEGLALVNCLMDSAMTPSKIPLAEDVFLITQGINHTFIGTSIRDSSHLIVAHRANDHVVVVMGHSGGRGSFIFELREALSLKAQGKLVTQLQLEQAQELLPTQPEFEDIPELATPVAEADLVDLMS